MNNDLNEIYGPSEGIAPEDHAQAEADRLGISIALDRWEVGSKPFTTTFAPQTKRKSDQEGDR